MPIDLAGRGRAAIIAISALVLLACQRVPLEDEASRSQLFIEGPASASELIRSSETIVLGIPSSSWEVRVLAGGELADYVQSVSILKVFKPEARVSEEHPITVIRIGPAHRPAIPDAHSDRGDGPLPNAPHVLFLTPGGQPSTWSVVGHRVGALRVANDRIIGGEFRELSGLSMDGLRRLVEEQV